MTFWRRWSSHQQRWATALLIGVPLAGVLGWAPIPVWIGLVAVASAVGLWEFQAMVLSEGLPGPWQAFYISAALGLPAAAYGAGANGLHAALVAWLFAGLVSVMVGDPLNRRQMDRLSHLCLGWLYVPYPLSYVLLLGRGESPRAWIFYVLLVLVAGDAGAYYTGKAIGKHKLNRVVSPNKTIEGSIGGLMASTLVGALYGLLFIDSRSVVLVIFMALALELVGQVGDLIESMLKRMHGKKDSSGLLPGHGGLLDRLDSLLFAFPVTWLIMHL